MTDTTSIPTLAAHGALQTAYDTLNRELWAGSLPDVLITLQRREVRVLGYFSADRFGRLDAKGQRVHELAMNPMHFQRRTPLEVLSTLAHEMAHVWQEVHGKAPRNGYHDRQWGAEMDRVGLVPSNTSKPGGKRTGQQMSHYIADGGAFSLACEDLLATGWRLHYYDRAIEAFALAGRSSPAAPASDGLGDDAAGGTTLPPVNRTNRVRYSCPDCGVKAWGKPGIRIGCLECDEEMGAGA